jgi:toxin YoeB
MKISFYKDAWEDYCYWQKTDKKMCSKINALLQDIMRSPFSGLGKPEPLRFEMTGAWSRRIDQEHRLVYVVHGDTIEVLQCRWHY